jgi:hypothetical protein
MTHLSHKIFWVIHIKGKETIYTLEANTYLISLFTATLGSNQTLFYLNGYSILLLAVS